MVALASAHRAAGDRTSAAQRLQQVLALDPGHLGALQAMVDDGLAAGDIGAALRWARQAQARHPRRAQGWHWEGAVHASRQDWPLALAAWRQAQSRAQAAGNGTQAAGQGGKVSAGTGGNTATATTTVTTAATTTAADTTAADAAAADSTTPLAADIAMKLYSALRAAGKPDEAKQLLADWQRRHPQDAALPLHAADTLAAAGEHAAAEALYRTLLQARPQDAHGLNNLAWVRLQQRQPDALQWAEKAVAADPGQSNALDTLAQALAAAGQAQRAFEVQQQAVAAAPRRTALRVALVRLALQLGDKQRAREELAGLTTRDPRLATRPEVQALMRQAQ